MDFGLFGIGLPQILLIAFVAIIVFGPDKLPGIARQAGKYVNELRKLTQEAKGELQTLTKEFDISNDLKSMQNDIAGLRKELSMTGEELAKEFENIHKEVDLRDTDGNLMGQQRQQYTYQVEDTADGVKVEEIVKRETIIQNAITNEPGIATQTVMTTSNDQTNSHLTTNSIASLPFADIEAFRADIEAVQNDVHRNRSEMFSRIDALERQFLDRLDRIEQSLLAQQSQR